MKTIQCKCSYCGQTLERRIVEVNRSKTKEFFCDIQCNSSFYKKRQVHKCKNCGKEVERTPSATKENVFCNRSCSATYNNKVSIKRQKENKCKVCKNLIFSGYTYCDSCYAKKHYLDNKTIFQATNHIGKHASRFAGIRGNARLVYKNNNLPRECKCCGYNKHIEVCHIKDISSFPETTPIKEVNDIKNLVGLCKNHHWELDHKLLDKENLQKIQSGL